MNQVVEGFIGLITSEGALDFNRLLLLVLGYLAALWLAFSLWVFVDARRRYHNILVALGITLAVFVLNFPALILYLIVRPEDEMHHMQAGYTGREYLHGGVEVPVIKFVDNNGDLKLSLNLKVNSNWNPDSDMNVEVAWDSAREDIVVEEPKQPMITPSQDRVIINKDKVTTVSTEKSVPLSTKLRELRSKATKSIKNLRVAKEEKAKETEVEKNAEAK